MEQKVEPSQKTLIRNIKHKQPKPKIVRIHHYNCAYVRLMAVQIIFPVILQTVINLIMLSTEGEGAKVVKPSI